MSAKYYIENKKRLSKKARERYQNLPKEEKKSDNMTVNFIKISQKMKEINWLSIEKKYYRMRKKKCFIVIIRKYFNLRKFAPL